MPRSARESRPGFARVPRGFLTFFSEPDPIIERVNNKLSDVSSVNWEKVRVVIAKTFSYATTFAIFIGYDCTLRSTEIQNVCFEPDSFAGFRQKSDWRYHSDSEIIGGLFPRIYDFRIHSAIDLQTLLTINYLPLNACADAYVLFRRAAPARTPARSSPAAHAARL